MLYTSQDGKTRRTRWKSATFRMAAAAEAADPQKDPMGYGASQGQIASWERAPKIKVVGRTLRNPYARQEEKPEEQASMSQRHPPLLVGFYARRDVALAAVGEWATVPRWASISLIPELSAEKMPTSRQGVIRLAS